MSIGFKFPDPPDFYKKFENGADGLLPPNIDKIKSQSKTYLMLGKVYQFEGDSHNEIWIPLEEKLVSEKIINFKDELKKLNYSILHKMIKFFDIAESGEYEMAKKVLEDIKAITNNLYYALAIYKHNIGGKKEND